jgi:hypothetical protein
MTGTLNFHLNAEYIDRRQERVAYIFMVFLHFPREMDPLQNALAPRTDILKFRVTLVIFMQL